MLIQFRFQNFKSFRDDTILDLSATKITEHSQHIVSLGNENLLPAAAIFGANASGKSNMIGAFRFMATYVLNSFMYGGDSEKEPIDQLQHTPFLFDSTSREAESSFEVYFTRDGGQDTKIYNYGFTLKQNGVAEEWLNTRAKTARKSKEIFYRNGEELLLTGISPKRQENILLSLEKETLVVSLGAKLKIDILKTVRDWFYHLNFADFGDPYENAFLTYWIPLNCIKDRSAQVNMASYLSSFDPSILDLQVKVLKEDEDGGQLEISTIHRTTDGGTAQIPISQESGGTLKMFALYPTLQKTLENGSVLFVDELNSRLHPLLVRNFLLTFLNPDINVNHAQIIFTTHDSWQLSNNLLRRDEIWFTEKNEDGISTLYSLSDFMDEDGVKIRKDENHEKNYLLGKYGAIPTLKYLDVLRGE
ncbi:MAG: ATP-binding protein [Oscillospiraceae bacterium]|nr:ATP-binding protein [Oscillospiraceae bacterium]